MSPHRPPDVLLSEELAHRVLARAVEIEAREGPTITLARLRQVAAEAGIAPAALEQALQEVRRPATSTRIWRWAHTLLGRLSSASPFPLLNRLTLNLVAFGAAWVLVALSAKLGQVIGAGWVVHNGLMILATLLGTVMAVGARARLTAILLAIMAAAMLAEYPLQLIYGIPVARGAAAKLALLLAAGFGLLLSRMLTRPSKQWAPLDPPAVTTPQPAEPAAGEPPPDFPALRLRAMNAGG